jgi:hypothetical protein
VRPCGVSVYGFWGRRLLQPVLQGCERNDGDCLRLRTSRPRNPAHTCQYLIRAERSPEIVLGRPPITHTAHRTRVPEISTGTLPADSCSHRPQSRTGMRLPVPARRMSRANRHISAAAIFSLPRGAFLGVSLPTCASAGDAAAARNERLSIRRLSPPTRIFARLSCR